MFQFRRNGRLKNSQTNAPLKLSLRIYICGVTVILRSAPELFRCAKWRDHVLSPDVAAASESQAETPKSFKPLTSDELLAVILKSLDDDKAEEIAQIDLRGKSSMGDYMVVCSGRSSRQVSSIAQKLVDKLKVEHGRASRIEGRGTGDWVLVDTGDIIVHVFRPEVREFYQLEKMWLSPDAANA